MSVNFRIFGDIKQRYLPFVLNPSTIGNSIGSVKTEKEIKDGKEITKYVNQYDESVNKIQLFSFKKIENNSNAQCNINIVPESYKRIFNDDIANQLLYFNNASKITFNDILNNIPVIEIREFLPDTKLEQFLNFFSEVLGYLMEKIKNIFNSDKNNATSENKEKSSGSGFSLDSVIDFGKGVGKHIQDLIEKCFSYLSPADTKMTGTNLYVKNGKSRFEENIDVKNSADGFNMYNSETSKGQLERILMHDFPKFMYYKLQSVTNSNVYVIPNNLNEKMLYSSNGTGGWDGGGIAITQEVGKIPLIGGLVSKLLKGPLGIFDNLRISYMPYWKADKGQDAHPNVKVEFELINDTVESALNNFLFVNTIVPNNKIIQYGMFQHSSCLYDVKIGGYDRLFACSGKFEVKHKGMLRIPSDEFFNKIRKHINSIIVDPNNFLDGLKKNDLIRIPDTYEVSMEFTSLLPATFNNYMFTYSTNESIVNNISKLKNHTPGPFATLLQESITDMNTILSAQAAESKNKEETQAKKATNIEAQPDITKAGE